MKYLFFLFSVIFVFGCNPDKKRVVDRNNPVFKTNDATRLFFKNIRTLYYDIEERNEGKIQVLKLSERIEDSTKAIINVHIINNWFQDRAYPMISPSAYFEEDKSIEVDMIDPQGKTEHLSFNVKSNMNEHFYFATAIYEGILKNYDFKLQSGEEIFTNSNQKEAFRMTMVDYYRLVGIY